MGVSQSPVQVALRWLAFLVVLVVGAMGLHTIVPLADGPLAVGIVAALLWLAIYAWQTYVT